MSASSSSQPLNLQLWFGDVLVADLWNVIPHQGTWFAEYSQIVAPDEGSVQARLCEFIAFCEQWHRRLHRGKDPDAGEFDRYVDVVESESWRVPCPDGTELRMAGSPIFADGEINWNHPEDEPSREIAAGETWARMTGGEQLP